MAQSPAFIQRPEAPLRDLECTLEALLFVAQAPLSLPRIAELTGAAESAIQSTLTCLQRQYRHRGIVIKRSAAGYRFTAAARSSVCLQRYLEEPRSLSDEATETLALVAYLQPMTHAQLSAYRAGDPTHTLETLLHAGLLTATMNDEGIAHYITTSGFLDCTNLSSLDDLPLIETEADLAMDMYEVADSNADTHTGRTGAHSPEYAE